jgi:hypothetical protein
LKFCQLEGNLGETGQCYIIYSWLHHLYVNVQYYWIKYCNWIERQWSKVIAQNWTK